MSRILVTGAAGFIGSAVVRHLIGQGHQVLSYDALTYAGSLTNLREVSGNRAHQFVRGDIRDPAALSHVFTQFRPERVMHLAAESHVDRSIYGPADFISTNIEGTFRVLEAVRSLRDAGGGMCACCMFPRMRCSAGVVTLTCRQSAKASR